jgi:sulfide:quinone oxidoreductase
VTPEPAPLAAFGAQASEAVGAELREVGVRFEGGVRAEVEHGHATTVLLRPSERRLEVDRAVALPRLAARVPVGVPAGDEGFIPVDERCKVSGLERVWAAGDCIVFPIKFGGLAAEQADAAAEGIAALAGADVSPEPFRPVLRGTLLTGRDPRYLRHAPESGGGEDIVADHALWWPPGKIAGRRLAPYLAARDEAAVAGPAPHPAGTAVQIDLHRRVGPPS